VDSICPPGPVTLTAKMIITDHSVAAELARLARRQRDACLVSLVSLASLPSNLTHSSPGLPPMQNAGASANRCRTPAPGTLNPLCLLAGRASAASVVQLESAKTPMNPQKSSLIVSDRVEEKRPESKPSDSSYPSDPQLNPPCP